jgi:hypothetical protein
MILRLTINNRHPIYLWTTEGQSNHRSRYRQMPLPLVLVMEPHIKIAFNLPQTGYIQRVYDAIQLPI